MKKSAIFLSAVLLFCACQKDNEPEFQEGPREWYRLVSTDTLQCSDIAIDITGIPLGQNSWIVKNTFLYHSSKNELSGCVCWPFDCENKEIWLENHYTTSKWNECPSQASEPGMIMCYTRKAIYVGADHIGLGLSRDLPAKYFNSPVLAQQSIDCFKAALQLLKDNGICLEPDFRTYNFGYSLGGSVTLGVAKLVEMDTELQKTVHLKKSFCGGGPYDQVAMIESYFSEPGRTLELPVVMALDAENLLNSNLVSEITNLFSDKFIAADILGMVESKQYGTNALDKVIRSECGYSLSECLSPEVLDTTGTLFHSYRDAHKAFDLTEYWEPSIPVLLFHSKDDGIVPFVCMDNFRKRHRDNHYITYIEHYGSHVNAGIDFYEYIFGETWMKD